MKRADLEYAQGFKVVAGNARSQAATMVIPPGGKEGSANNKHDGADQWLLVVKGHGEAVLNGHRYALQPDSLILIEQGDTHEIRNTGSAAMTTLNFYVPPAYTAKGGETEAGRG